MYLARDAGSACGETTPADPSDSLFTTRPPTPRTRAPVGVIVSSGRLEKQLCQSQEVVFEAPPYALFIIEEIYYGVTASGKCEAASEQNCKMALVPSCNYEMKCHYHLKNAVNVEACNSSAASYIFIAYSFIPGSSLQKLLNLLGLISTCHFFFAQTNSS